MQMHRRMFLSALAFAAGGAAAWNNEKEEEPRMIEPDWREMFRGGRARYKGLVGPVGCGKTYELCREAGRLAETNPGRDGLIVAPYYGTTNPALDEFIRQLLDVNEPFEYSIARQCIFLPRHDSAVWFRDLDAAELVRLRGFRVAWAGIDNLDVGTPKRWSRIDSLVRDPRAGELCTFATFRYYAGWIQQAYERAPGDSLIVKADAATTYRPIEGLTIK